MQEHEYLKVIDRVHITTAIEHLKRVRPDKSIGGLNESELHEIVIRLREWEDELFRVVDIKPD